MEQYYKAEKINTHGGSIRVYIKKGKKVKVDRSVKSILIEEKNLELKNTKLIKNLEKSL